MTKIIQFIIMLSILTCIGSCKSQTSKAPEVTEMLEKVKENFVYIEGGTFKMGHSQIPDSSPEHDVTLNSYSISKYETTFDLKLAFSSDKLTDLGRSETFSSCISELKKFR